MCKLSGIKRFLAIILTGILIILSMPCFDIKAAGNSKITSMDDFYTKLSEQIFSHSVDVTYDLSDRGLIDKIMDLDMDEYAFQYNPDSPLTSGCYLSYYLDYLNLYYRHGTLRVVIQFRYSKQEMEEHFAKIESLAMELKKNSDYETVQNVHDYLIEKFEYDQKTLFKNHTDIEGFRDGVMVCSGYSLAAYALLNMADIPTRVVTGYGGNGTADTSNHMWNMVELDGKWYNMDITWDDVNGTKPTYTYFLKSDDDFPNHKRLGYYQTGYFNITIAEKSYKLTMGMGTSRWYIYVIAVVALMCFISFSTRIKGRGIDIHEKYDYRIISSGSVGGTDEGYDTYKKPDTSVFQSEYINDKNYYNK